MAQKRAPRNSMPERAVGLAAVATALREGLVRAERGDGALMLVLGGAA